MAAASWLATAAPAHAWTEANVRSVHARLVLDRDATAEVALDLTVHVRGGWLEQLDLAGLDPDLALDETTPPVLVTETGEQVLPQVRAKGGRMRLSFRRHEAPHHGTYHVLLSYRTSLAHRATQAQPDRTVRVRWTLPGWRSGLDAVVLEVDAPRGTREAPPEDPEAASVESKREPRGPRVLITWTRPHLPRTVPWTIAFDVPARAMAPSLGSPAPRVHHPHAPTPPARLDAFGRSAGLALVIALLALAAWLLGRHADRRARLVSRPLVPMPDAVRGLVVLGCAAGGAVLGPHLPAVAVAMLTMLVAASLDRTTGEERPPRLGAFRPVTAEDRRLAARAVWRAHIVGPGVFDATTALGVVILITIFASVFLLMIREPSDVAAATLIPGALLLVPPFVTSTRFHRPLPPAQRLHRLLHLATDLAARVPVAHGIAVEPVVHADAAGRLQEARLRLEGGPHPTGLVRLEVALGHLSGAGGVRAVPMLIALAVEGTTADVALGTALPDAAVERSAGGRIARLQRLGRDPSHIVCDVHRCLADAEAHAEDASHPPIGRRPTSGDALSAAGRAAP